MRFQIIAFVLMLLSVEASITVSKSHLLTNISSWHSREYPNYEEERGEASTSVSRTKMLDELGLKAIGVQGLSTHPALKTAIEYLEKQQIGSLPKTKGSLIGGLIDSYKVDGVARIIEEGKMNQDPGIKAFMKLIQSEFLMQLCITEGKSPSDVFKLLKLHEEGESLFESPLLNTWTNYVDTYNKFQSEHVSLFATLKEQFNAEKEVELIRMLFDAELKQRTLVRMRAEQLKTWRGKGIPPEDVFNLLELNKVEFAWMNGGRFAAWWKYVNKFYSKFSDEKNHPIYILQKYYGYAEFLEMIVDAKEIQATEEIAEEVEEKVLTYWGSKYRFENLDDISPVNEVFLALKLDQDAQPFYGARFETWVEFIRFIKESRPYLKFDVLDTLTKLLGEEKVIEVFTAEKNPYTIRLVKKVLQELSNETLRAQVPKSVLAVAYDNGVIRRTLGKRKRRKTRGIRAIDG